MTVYNRDMPKGDKPTFKQIKFAKAYIKNQGNASKSALEVYDVKRKDAKTVGYDTLHKPIVQKTIQELLNKNGLKLDDIIAQTTKSIKHNLTYGKASQAVGADLLKFTYKLHNAIPSSKNVTTKEVKKVFLDKDFNEVKTELEASITTTQALLNDL